MDEATVRQALSADRFSTYLGWAKGNHDRALELYALNIQVSEALYPALQMLEVVLRNRIHAVMSEALGPEWLLQTGVLIESNQVAQVRSAIAGLVRDKKTPTPSGVVSSLTFSFWTTMVGPSYETLWQTMLHRIGQRDDGKGLRRKDFSAPLTPIRLLRNRIAHHEPILAWNLPQHHIAIFRVAGWLSVGAALWWSCLDRFSVTYPETQIALVDS